MSEFMIRRDMSHFCFYVIGICLIFSEKEIGMVWRCQRVRLGLQKVWFCHAKPYLLQSKTARSVF